MPSWNFYGRRAELGEIDRLLARPNFFFCSISGRRRIGKTSLIQEALKRRGTQSRAMYIQIPDSDERGVIQVFEDAIEDTFSDLDFARKACTNFSDICLLLQVLWTRKFIAAIDEFQYFHRSSLSPFLSHLQSNIDHTRSSDVGGGLFALGSIHTEMTAVLENKNSPLFNRVTDRIQVGHWDFETLFEMFREHEIADPLHRLFLWSLFEGVPKFYRDCFDHAVLTPSDTHRVDTLHRMFFEGSSPLKDEAENWFLRELRGRYDSVLKLVARLGPCSHGVLKGEYDRTGPRDSDRQLGGYLQNLIERYQMIERVGPIFAPDNGRKTRYRIADNFLTAWLCALARNVQLARIRPPEEAISKANDGLKMHEGHAFEKMVKLVLEECSRKNKGDFSLTNLAKGYWNKPDGQDIELDLVAINEIDKVVRVGSCKRSAAKHNNENLLAFNGHIDRFKRTVLGKKYKEWRIERALYAPLFTDEHRNSLSKSGYVCADMTDFDRWLG